MSIRTVGELKFATTSGDTRIIRIPDPNTTVNQAALNSAVSMFLSADPFDETVGQLERLVHAHRVAVNRTQLIP